MKFHYHIIVNPASGGGKGKKAAERIQQLLVKHQFPHHFYFTAYAGQESAVVTELLESTLISWEDFSAKESEKPFPLLLVLGGDGTLHQVINQIHLEKKNIPLAYIPAGSGNDFARGISLSLEAEKAFWHIAKTTKPQEISLISYNEKIQNEQKVAINNVGIGLDAAVVHTAHYSGAKNQFNKYNLNSLAYHFSIVKVLFRQSGFPILVEANGRTYNFDKALLCTVTNHPYFGGGIAIAPSATTQKKNVELVIVEKIAWFKILWLIFLLLRKKQTKSRYFKQITANKLRIVSTIPQYGQADGEELGSRSFDILFSVKTQQIWS